MAHLQPRDTVLSINGFALKAGEASLESAVDIIKTSGGAPIEVSQPFIYNLYIAHIFMYCCGTHTRDIGCACACVAR
jgi:hypothetical protein